MNANLEQHLVREKHAVVVTNADDAASADVFVLASHSEGLPMSVLEASALGKPIIAADIGGLPELVADGESGWLFRTGSCESLGACLESVAAMADSGLVAAGRASRARVVASFSPERYLAETRAVYEELGVNWPANVGREAGGPIEYAGNN